MSGHSKWSTIKRKKAKEDERRGRVFSGLAKEVTAAARLGGGDPDANPRLRLAVDNAKAANMPNENIQRAILKGTGELEGGHVEEAVYEGYGPGGVAIYVEVITDNKRRTVAEIRHILEKTGGSLGAAGCVAWMFEPRGQLYLDASRYEEDSVMMLALEAGAEDVEDVNGYYVVSTTPEAFGELQERLSTRGLQVEEAGVEMIPRSTVPVEGQEAERLLRLLQELEDHDDVQRVSANFDISEETMLRLG